MAYYESTPDGFKKVAWHVNYHQSSKGVEPEDHIQARLNTMGWFERRNKYIVYGNKPVQFPPSFIEKHKLKYEVHEYDVWVYGSKSALVEYVIEIDQKENDTIYDHTLGTKRIEVSQSRHNKPNQIIKDQIAEDYIHEYYPNTKFIRIQKTSCFKPEELDKILREFTK